MFQKKSQIFFFIILLISSNLFSEGFIAGTLVKVKDNFVPIEQLKENDSVISYNYKNKNVFDSKILKVKKQNHKHCIKLIVNSKEIITAPEQKFFCPLRKGNWIKAIDLQQNDFILCGIKNLLRIESICKCDANADFYCLSIENNHNFFVTENEVFAHNIPPIMIPVCEYVIGKGFCWLLGWRTFASVVFSVAVTEIVRRNGGDVSHYSVDLTNSNRNSYLFTENNSYHAEINIKPISKQKFGHIFTEEHGFGGGQDPDKWWERILKRVREAYETNQIHYKDGQPYWELRYHQNYNPKFGDLIIRGIINSGVIEISNAFLRDFKYLKK